MVISLTICYLHTKARNRRGIPHTAKQSALLRRNGESGQERAKACRVLQRTHESGAPQGHSPGRWSQWGQLKAEVKRTWDGRQNLTIPGKAPDLPLSRRTECARAPSGPASPTCAALQRQCLIQAWPASITKEEMSGRASRAQLTVTNREE